MIRFSLVLLSLLLSAGSLCAQDKPAPQLKEVDPNPNQHLFGGRIVRTMTRMAASNERVRYPVKIVYYGQSITAQGWRNILQKKLQERFPHAEFTFVNKSIGGFEAPNLVRTAAHDLYPEYPDLVIFHDYWGERSGHLQRMVHNLRKMTMEGASKTIDYKENGDSGSNYIIRKVEGGDFVNYWDPKTGKVIKN